MTVELTTNRKVAETSSKGNQEKWLDGNWWYKLDLFGYEALSEVVVSSLLKKTNVIDLGFRFVNYQLERVKVRRYLRTGCSSENFLQQNESIMTIADLLKKGLGPEWQKNINRASLKSKIKWLADTIAALTGLTRMGEYLTLIFEMDMLFLNEDRHLNNVAVLRLGESFDYCPIFDFGAGLLSNTRDYPMDILPKALIHSVQARPFNCGFTRQVHAAQEIFSPQLECSFSKADLDSIFDLAEGFYSKRDLPDIKDRIRESIRSQYKKLYNQALK